MSFPLLDILIPAPLQSFTTPTTISKPFYDSFFLTKKAISSIYIIVELIARKIYSIKLIFINLPYYKLTLL